MFIVPDTVRFMVNQTLGGRPVVNVLDYHITGFGAFGLREAAIRAHADLIAEQWSNNYGLLQASTVGLQSVGWVDLDTADGSTGIGGTGADPPWPTSAVGSTSVMPSNVAVLIHKNLAGASRGSRRGRMFIAGCQEAATSAGSSRALASSDLDAYNTQSAEFLDNTNGIKGLYTSNFVVVHIATRDPNGNPLTGTTSPITSLTCDPILATQRRRLR